MEQARYTIIRHEIATSVPELLDHICRAGNADHGTQRTATLVNVWRRQFALKMANPSLSDADIASRSARGLSNELGKEAAFLPKFVRTWSGGREATVLQDLEQFEQSCTQKRKLRGVEFKQMAELPVHVFKTWVPAMLKASMQCPKEFLASGLWTVSDFNQLKSQSPKIMSAVKLGSADIESARSYVLAHTVFAVEQQHAFAIAFVSRVASLELPHVCIHINIYV